MATRCRIGLKLDDGTIKHSYCHWDGYPDGVGSTLVRYYNDVDKASELLNLGDMSYLAKKINPEGFHNFDKPENDVTVFYGRDRGESGVESVVTSLEEYHSVTYSSFIDYLYLFNDGKWEVYDNLNKSGWKSVEDFLSTNLLTT